MTIWGQPFSLITHGCEISCFIDFGGPVSLVAPRTRNRPRCDTLICMRVTLVQIGALGSSAEVCEGLVQDYLRRCRGVLRCETQAFRNEGAFLDWLAKLKGRTEAQLLLLDGRGKQMSSEELAAWLGKRRDDGTQHAVFAVGPADGWSEEARTEGKRRGGLLSLGPMTLAHSLARLVMAEQIYRACTILTGHPYHRG